MTLFSGIRSINTLILILVLVGSGVARAGNEKSLRQAVVSADMLKAFAEANARSNVVRLLAKGEVVSIILKVSTSGEDWCRVVLQDQSKLTGYVSCKGLTAIASTSQPAGIRKEPANQVPTNSRLLSNNDVLNMHKAGLPAEILVAKIKSSVCDFDTSPTALESMESAGIADNVILAIVEAPASHCAAASPAIPDIPAANVSDTPPSHSIRAKGIQQTDVGSTCVILKRMGPADQITSHLYAFGVRGKQFQYVEGNLPNGVTFHGRLTDHDVRIIQDHGGRVQMLEPKYSVADLEEARKGCQAP
jgi:hypothetical protein